MLNDAIGGSPSGQNVRTSFVTASGDDLGKSSIHRLPTEMLASCLRPLSIDALHTVRLVNSSFRSAADLELGQAFRSLCKVIGESSPHPSDSKHFSRPFPHRSSFDALARECESGPHKPSYRTPLLASTDKGNIESQQIIDFLRYVCLNQFRSVGVRQTLFSANFFKAASDYFAFPNEKTLLNEASILPKMHQKRLPEVHWNRSRNYGMEFRPVVLEREQLLPLACGLSKVWYPARGEYGLMPFVSLFVATQSATDQLLHLTAVIVALEFKVQVQRQHI